MSTIVGRRAAVFLPLILSATLALPAVGQTPSDHSATPVVEGVALSSEVDLTRVKLASKIMDADAYTTGGEKLGDVSDILLNQNGNAIAISVSVGGFLGIDEANVAIPMRKISFEYDRNELKVIADVSREEVKIAADAK